MRKRARFTPSLALPVWAWYLALFALPVLLILRASFGTKIAGGGGRYSTDDPTLDRFREALSPALRTVLAQTLEIAVVGTVGCLVVALPAAYWLAYYAPHRSRNALVVLIIVPFWTNALIRTVAWRIVLAPTGWLSSALESIGLIDRPLQLLDRRLGVQIGVIYNYLPLMLLPLLVAFGRLDRSHRDASRDLGAGRVRTFGGVTLPAIATSAAAAALLVFVPLTGDYVTPRILGGADGTMAGSVVASQFLEAQNPPLGAAIAIVLIVAILATVAVTVAIVVAVRAVWRRTRRIDVTTPGDAGPLPAPVAARAPRVDLLRFGLGAWTAAVYGFLYVPLLFVVIHSFTRADSLFRWDGFTLDWYRELWDNRPLVDSLSVSLKVAGGCTIVGILIGVPAGIAATRSGSSRALVIAFTVVLVTPEIVSAIGLQLWFVDVGGPLRHGITPLIAGVSVFSIAVTAIMIRARLTTIDPAWGEAAADLYAAPARRERTITLPFLAPTIFTTALLSFTLALDNTVTAQFVSRPGTTPYSAVAFSAAARGNAKPYIGAASSVLLVVTLAAFAVLAVVNRRRTTVSLPVAYPTDPTPDPEALS